MLLATGAGLIVLSATVPVAHPLVGLAVGTVLVLVGGCPLVRRWPRAEPDETDEAGA
jgi:hypothetical protein